MGQEAAGGTRLAGSVGPVRIGMVLPVRSGGMRVDRDSQQLAGESARRGASMAEEDYGELLTAVQRRLEVLTGSAPDANAAVRAAERLAGTEGLFALVGGFGVDQAVALSRVAEERGIIFVNIGSPSEALRAAARGSHTFHVESTAGSYLEALIGTHAESGFRRWFLLHGDDDEGRSLLGRARSILGRSGAGHFEAGHVEAGTAAISSPSSHSPAFEAIRNSDAQIVLMLLNWRAQLDFLGHYEATELPQPVTGFPFPVTQTRDFLASAVRAAPSAGVGARVSLWEPDSDAGSSSADLGRAFQARWGVPMDGPAWAAYVSVGMLVEAVRNGDALQPAELLSSLERSAGCVDLYKGATTFFRRHDHQLQQPLYRVYLDPAARGPSDVVRLSEEIPFPSAQGSRLDAPPW